MGVPSFAASPHLPAQGKGDEIPERGERTQSGEDEVRGALSRALCQRQRHRQQHEQVARRAQQPRRADGDDVIREKPRRLARAQLRRGRGQQAERSKARDQVRQPEAERVAPLAPAMPPACTRDAARWPPSWKWIWVTVGSGYRLQTTDYRLQRDQTTKKTKNSLDFTRNGEIHSRCCGT